MTTDLEDQLAAGLAAQAAEIRLTTDVVDAARRRHSRRTAMFRTAYAAAALSVAGVVTVAFYPTAGQAPLVTAESTAVLSPALQLAAAAAASDNTSYQIRITGAWAKGPVPFRPFSDLQGAFDPATTTGYLQNADGGLEQRLINGTFYNRGTSDTSEPFHQEPGRFETLPLTKVLGDTGLQSADPQQLVQAMQQANATITQTAGGFHYSFSKPPLGGATSVSEGDITLDANGRIAKVTYSNTTTLADGFTIRGQLTIELFGYGTAVQVEMPANVRVMTE